MRTPYTNTHRISHAVSRPYRKVAKKPKHAKYSRDDNSRCVYPFALWAYTGQ